MTMIMWGSGILFVVCLWMLALSAEANKKTSCSCGVSKKGRIVGGTKASASEYPWVVRVVRSKDMTHICAGSIINGRAVLGNTRCTRDLSKGDPMSIVAGISDVSETGQVIAVEKVVENEKYAAPPPDHLIVDDIAILFLAKPLQFNDKVSPVCLPSSRINMDDKWVKIIGWGATGNNQEKSKQLLAIDVKSYPFKTCKVEGPFLQVPQTQICTKAPGKSTCTGDVGSPVVYLDPETNRYTIVGLPDIWDEFCGNFVYSTEVGAYLPWIKSTLAARKMVGCYKV